MFASAHFVINGTMKPQPAPGPAWPCQISFGGFDIFNFVTEDNRLAISSVVLLWLSALLAFVTLRLPSFSLHLPLLSRFGFMHFSFLFLLFL